MSLKQIYMSKKNLNYYQILEVNPDATDKELKKAKKRLLKTYHPDLCDKGEETFAEELTTLVNTAYDALSDKNFRDKYDANKYNNNFQESNKNLFTNSVKEENNFVEINRGNSESAVATVNTDTLIEGGFAEVDLVDFTGAKEGKFAKKKRVVKISKASRGGQVVIYEKLGEQIKDGENGNLILLLEAELNETTPFDTLKLVTPTSTCQVVMGSNFNRDEQGKLIVGDQRLELPKKDYECEMLFIKNVPDRRESMVIRY